MCASGRGWLRTRDHAGNEYNVSCKLHPCNQIGNFGDTLVKGCRGKEWSSLGGTLHGWGYWGARKGLAWATHLDSIVETQTRSLGCQLSGLSMVPQGCSSMCLWPSYSAYWKLSLRASYLSRYFLFPPLASLSPWAPKAACLHKGLQAMLTFCGCPSHNRLSQELRSRSPNFNYGEARAFGDPPSLCSVFPNDLFLHSL